MKTKLILLLLPLVVMSGCGIQVDTDYEGIIKNIEHFESYKEMESFFEKDRIIMVDQGFKCKAIDHYGSSYYIMKCIKDLPTN